MQEPSILAETVEIPASELQSFFDDLIMTYNALNEILKDQRIPRGSELAELNTRAIQAVKTAKSPIEKLLLLNAFIRQQIAQVKKALQARRASRLPEGRPSGPRGGLRRSALRSPVATHQETAARP